MAISNISSASAAAASVAMPTHAAGDLLLFSAWRNGSTTPPSLPGGCTNIQTAFQTLYSIRVGYKIAASSSETSGTWTNATHICVSVYRGQHATTPIGGSNTGTGTSSSTVNYPSVTMTVGDGTSWVMGSAGISSADVDINTAPAGFTNRTNTSNLTALHDTNAGVASWAGVNDTGFSFITYCAVGVEIEAAAAGGGATVRLLGLTGVGK